MLPKKQFGILEILATKGAMPQRGLAEATEQSVGNVNRLMKELSSAGLVNEGSITGQGISTQEPYRIKRAVFLALGSDRTFSPSR